MKLKFLVLPIVVITLFLSACTSQFYTISFVSNGGSETAEITLVSESVFVYPTTPEKENYVFDGWFLDNNTFLNEVEDGYMINSDITLFAKWSGEEHTITFNSNGGTAVSDFTYEYGQSIDSIGISQKTGYYFDGWFLDNGTFNTQLTADLITSNLTVYAKWSPYLGTALYNGEPLEEIAANTFLLTMPEANPDYIHSLLDYAPSNETYTYEIGEQPEFVGGQGYIEIRVYDSELELLGIVGVNVYAE